MREKNGRIQRPTMSEAAAREPEISLVSRRAELVGPANAKDQRAGSAIGVLYLRGDITKAQYEGAEEFARLWLSWKSMAGIPARQITQGRRGTGADVDPSDWEKVKARISSIKERLASCEQPALVWATIDNIVLDDWTPPAGFATAPADSPQGRAFMALRTGLYVLAAYFGKTDSQAA